MSDNGLTLGPAGRQLRARSLGVGLAVLASCFVAALMVDRAQFFRSYLVAYLVMLAPALGSLAVLMLHHVTGGAWGRSLHGVLAALARTIPLLGVLFVPLLFGLTDVYPWARWSSEELAGSGLLEQKHRYLNVPFFVVRAGVYFAVWIALALLLTPGSENDLAAIQRRRHLSGPGLVLYGLTVTFAALDWVMSLEPFWSSTIFGMLFAAGQVLAGFAFAVAGFVLAVAAAGAADRLARQDLQDLGNLLLAFVMLWAYLAFSQFLLVWYGNLPEEVPYYLRRLGEGWQAPALLLIVLQFALPFLLLLSRDLKRDARALAAVALLVLAMRVVDLYWTVIPAFGAAGEPMRLHWLDAGVLVGVGGIWLAGFLHELEQRPLLQPEPAEEVAHA